MLTTPPGTSDVASTSASETAGSGPLLGGDDDGGVAGDEHRREHATQPEQRTTPAARGPTTPVGSGSEKLKYGPATGLARPATCAYLSAQPAY